MDQRLEAGLEWARQQINQSLIHWEPASGDASFRRYFRLYFPVGGSRILMDAPPKRENLRRFCKVDKAFSGLGLNVPLVYRANFEAGYALLSDLGSRTYLEALVGGADPDDLYERAFDALVRLASWPDASQQLPPYDAVSLNREMRLFDQWLISRYLELPVDSGTERILKDSYRYLVSESLTQPQVAVHRDYHSRNLMMAPPLPGILDFQDAVVGPVTYDLVSLLKDCYVAWPPERVQGWALAYHRRLRDSRLLEKSSEACFLKWFHCQGVQRHLKAAGIFARLCLRDGKPSYLADIPRVLTYISTACEQVPPLQALGEFVKTSLMPAFRKRDGGYRCAP